jgi:cyclopropane fatty-acyl-phospholipid synthase-like methyltransferase
MKNSTKNKMIESYNESLAKHGDSDFRSLNWGDTDGTSARFRYEQMDLEVNFENKSVAEIGCGWGSFFDFGFICDDYWGIDVNPNFVKIANKKYGGSIDKEFYVEDVLNMHTQSINNVDVAISSGVAGNIGGPAYLPEYLITMLRKMYSISNTVLVNFPSNRATVRAEGVEYFAPEYVLSQALQITNNVKLIHINKFDFLLRLDKNE